MAIGQGDWLIEYSDESVDTMSADAFLKAFELDE
jgi:hypothetical protein